MTRPDASQRPFHRTAKALGVGVLAAIALTACGSSKQEKKLANYEPEKFSSAETHSRTYPASEAQTCEAARRALLSQGYQVKDASAQQVGGVKAFQPENEVHVEVTLRVVCAKDARASADAQSKDGGNKSSTAFVTALQDRYALKKVSNSAGVGVGMVGSISLPYSSSEDSMVKVASQTVTDDRFYERFYALIDRYLVSQGPDPEPPAPSSSSKDKDKADDSTAKSDSAGDKSDSAARKD